MNFQKLFYPNSISIIGASRTEKTVGNDIVKNLVQQGFAGQIYPVNPKAQELYGKQVFASVGEIGAEVDLAIIAVPAAYVLEVIQEAHQKNNTQAFIVISAGFKETTGAELETAIATYCKENDLLLIGPNCLGVLNAEVKMNASFASIMPSVGNIAFISQSGALCTTVLDYAKQLKLGFSKFVSIGNKAVVDELILLQYLQQDPQTKVIAMYVEQLNHAPEFIKVVKEITTGENPKPVIILKSGKTEAGSKAVASHTGSLSGGSQAYDALFAQAGVIQAQTTSELFDLAAIFSENKLQAVDKVAIITNAGGPGVLATDAVISNGLELAELSEETKTKLQEFLPQAASVKNPVDVLGDAKADRYDQAIKLLEADQNVDALMVILTPQSMTEIEATAKAIVTAKQASPKPIVASFMGQETVATGVKELEAGGITTTLFPEPAAKALGQVAEFMKAAQISLGQMVQADSSGKEKVEQIFATAKQNGQTQFPEAQSLEILAAYNLPILPSKIATSPDQAQEFASQLNGPLAMKIVSPQILHKSDVGGIMLNVTAQDAAEKFSAMMQTVKAKQPEAKLEGVLLTQMAPAGGVEMILGSNKVAGLGSLILLGMGGIYVEILKDVQLRFAPLTKTDIEFMINNLKSAKILAGARGKEAFDLAALQEVINKLHQLILDFPQIKELDINPLLVLPQGQGARVLDARIVIS